MMMDVWQIFGIFVFIAGIMDALKQSFLTAKIKRYNSSKGVSRQFINWGIIHKIFLSIWAIGYLHDWVVSLSSLLALYTTCELWYWTWLKYPYKNRNWFGWKRPSFFKYIISSFTPNKYAERI